MTSRDIRPEPLPELPEIKEPAPSRAQLLRGSALDTNAATASYAEAHRALADPHTLAKLFSRLGKVTVAGRQPAQQEEPPMSLSENQPETGPPPRPPAVSGKRHVFDNRSNARRAAARLLRLVGVADPVSGLHYKTEQVGPKAFVFHLKPEALTVEALAKAEKAIKRRLSGRNYVVAGEAAAARLAPAEPEPAFSGRHGPLPQPELPLAKPKRQMRKPVTHAYLIRWAPARQGIVHARGIHARGLSSRYVAREAAEQYLQRWGVRAVEGETYNLAPDATGFWGWDVIARGGMPGRMLELLAMERGGKPSTADVDLKVNDAPPQADPFAPETVTATVDAKIVNPVSELVKAARPIQPGETVTVTVSGAGGAGVTERMPPAESGDREQRRSIAEVLERVYDRDAQRYRGGASDVQVAGALGLGLAQVARVRELLFGDYDRNEAADTARAAEMDAKAEELLDMAAKLADEARRLRGGQ